MRILKNAKRALLIVFSLFLSLSPSAALAIDQSTLNMYSQNNILFYDPTKNCNSGAMPSGSQITWIGDSYSVGAQTIIASKFPGVDYGETVNDASSYIQGSKAVSHGDTSNPSGLTILGNIINDNKLRKYLVFALGTNWSWTDQDISDFNNLVKDKDVTIVLVTSRTKATGDSYYVESNNRLKSYADDNENVIIADWYEIYNESYFATDSVHPTDNNGYQAWVDLIYDSIKSKVSSNAGTAGTGTGDFSAITQATNAEKSYFNHQGDIDAADWNDGDTESMKRLLENYGDLAYQLGRAVGAPYVAILVQMRYEDPYAVCGKNNFWGNGCDPSHAYAGGATIQGENLGEGFSQYGETLSHAWYDSVRGITDPKEYLETIGPLWVQGDPNGAGYGSIEGMKNSVDALQAFIDSSEGQAIVSNFHNYSGSAVCSSGGGNMDLNQTAIDLAWPIGDPHNSSNGGAVNGTTNALTATDKFMTALNEVGLANYGDPYVEMGASCDAFVATVVRYAGIDPNFQCCGTSNQLSYLRGEGASIFEEIEYSDTNDTSFLQPGDILILNGHIKMYIEIDGQGMEAQASYGDHAGQISNGVSLNDSLGRGKYYVFRVK